MSMVMCPECGTQISSRARLCVECGYVGDDPSRPISEQITREIVPTFKTPDEVNRVAEEKLKDAE